MKQRVINGNSLEFFDSSNSKKGVIKISGSDIIINPVDPSGTVIFGENGGINDIEIGGDSTPVDFNFLGGGTITSNGNELVIGETGDTLDLSKATIGAITASAFVGDGSKLTNVNPDLADYQGTVNITGSLYSSGNVGLGVTNINNNRLSLGRALSNTAGIGHLQLVGTDTGHQAVFRVDTSGTLHIDQNDGSSMDTNISIQRGGNVGIGSSNPSNFVEIFGPSSGDGTTVEIGNSYGESPKTILFSNTTADVGKIVVDGRNSAISNMPYMAFSLWNSTSTTVDEVMRFTRNGNVGIGTASPSYKLEVAGETKVTSLLLTDSNSGLLKGHNDAYHGIIFRGIPSSATGYGITAGDKISFYEYGGEFRFYQKNNVGGGTLDEVARIHHTNSFFNSNLGIGTTAPSYPLDVRGSARVGGVNGDVDFVIEADVDNSGEDDNPRLILRQDGGGINGYIGLNGTANATFTGAAANGMYINSDGPFQIANAGELISTFYRVGSDKRMGIGTDSPATNLHVKKTVAGVSASLMRLEGYVDGDLSTQSIFQEFVLRDTNGNETPQVKIGAQVGPNGDANTQEKEGMGAFVVYTNNSDSPSGDAADSLAERMRVDYRGFMGIGTTTPDSILDIRKASGTYNNAEPLLSMRGGNVGGNQVHKFEYTGDAGIYTLGYAGLTNDRLVLNGGSGNSGPSILFYDNANHTIQLAGSTTGISFFNGGNVGIGNTSPAYKLDVSGTVRINNGVGNGSGVDLYLHGSGDQVHTSGGSIFFGEYNYAASTYIRGYDNSAGLYFYGNGTLAMNVNGNGNVGIGTTSPTYKLDVAGDIIARDTYPSIYVDHSGTVLGGIRADATTKLELKTLTSAPLSFQVNSSEKMRITNDGKVGIGTTSPGYKLDVAGNLYATTLNAHSAYLAPGGDSYIGGEYNILYGIDTSNVTYTNITNLGNSLFDGTLSDTGGQITDQAAGAQILIENVTTSHTQGKWAVGYTTRYWSPKRFKIEAYNTFNGANRWETLVDYSSTDYPKGGGNRTHMFPLTESMIPNKLRFTFYSTYTDPDSNLQLGQLYCFHSQHSDHYPYKGLLKNNFVSLGGSTMTGNLEVNAHMVFTNGQTHNRLAKGSSYINLRDPWNNMHFKDAHGSMYFDSQAYNFRSTDQQSTWMKIVNGQVGIGTTSPSDKLDVRGGRSFFSPSGNSASGTNSHALVVRNLNDTAYTQNALNAYNNHTSYDIDTKAVFTVSARANGYGSIYTYANENNRNEPVAINRYVQLNSENSQALHQWIFYQYDGGGSTAADFKTPGTLWKVDRYVGQAADNILGLKGSGQLQLAKYGSGILSGTATYNLSVDSSGNLIETAVTQGAGNDAGTHTFSDTIDANATVDIFSITNDHGAQAFRVSFVANTSGYSVAKTYEVVHSYGRNPIYSKVVDTGGYEGNDFEPVFTNLSSDSTTVVCAITNNSPSINVDIVTTVVLAGSPTSITVTAL